jgi:Uri superfamily endonuclease
MRPIHSVERTIQRRKKNSLLKKFGINYDQYNQILEDQNNVCAICNNLDRNGRSLAVDHCHTTNKVRGLLCTDCNTALGLFKDNKDLLDSAIMYLNKDFTVPEVSDSLGYIDRDDRASWKMLVKTPDGMFPSLQHAGDYYKVNHTTVRGWCLEGSKYRRSGFSCVKMFISLNEMKQRIKNNVWD